MRMLFEYRIIRAALTVPLAPPRPDRAVVANTRTVVSAEREIATTRSRSPVLGLVSSTGSVGRGEVKLSAVYSHGRTASCRHSFLPATLQSGCTTHSTLNERTNGATLSAGSGRVGPQQGTVPHRYARPSVDTAHENRDCDDDATSPTRPSKSVATPKSTSDGMAMGAADMCPSWPNSLSPQLKTRPSADRARQCAHPALTCDRSILLGYKPTGTVPTSPLKPRMQTQAAGSKRAQCRACLPGRSRSKAPPLGLARALARPAIVRTARVHLTRTQTRAWRACTRPSAPARRPHPPQTRS